MAEDGDGNVPFGAIEYPTNDQTNILKNKDPKSTE